MGNVVFRNAKEYYCGHIKIFPDGEFGLSVDRLSLRRNHRSHIACILSKNNQTPTEAVNGHVYLFCPKGNAHRVYLEPKARITRDLMRNSGYNITIDRNTADFIVIPPLESHQVDRWNGNVVVYCPVKQALYILDIRDTDHVWTDEDREKLSEKLKRYFSPNGEEINIYQKSIDFDRFPIYWVPPTESYLDILEGSTKPYVLDTDVETDPLYEINIETLELWSHITDMGILEKCIIGCDWQKYPFTLHMFLEGESNTSRLYRQTNRNLKMVLEEIQHGYYLPNTKEVQPEDWNMSQMWLMHRLGIDDSKGGFVDEGRVEGLDSYYREFLRKRLLVAPMLISAPMALDNLKLNL